MDTSGDAASRAAQDLKSAARAVWALGDYHRFATELVWGLGEELVEACGIVAGQRVLDVATGTGNTALRAAAAGADVTASDLTTANFAAGRREAQRMGVDLEWVEADAEALPFGDDSFDVVTSTVGAMWAPDHQAVAAELVRVCRPGGTIAMINFDADGLLTEFLAVFEGFAPPPPPEASPPTLWGRESYVRELFGDRVEPLEFTRSSYVERVAGGPSAYVELYKQTFGPVVATYASLDDPQRVQALDARFLDFATRANRGPVGGPAELTFETVRIVGRVAG